MPESIRITGKTKVFGIFGDPVAHSLSPRMHNAAFEALSLPFCYLPFEVSPGALERATRAILALGIKGINVTIPHKETIIPFLDRLASTAERSGAVNTIEVSSGALIGHNTDGNGFVASLLEKGVDPAGKRIFILGAGGAARGVAVALAEKGAEEITFVNRTVDRAKHLAERLVSLIPGLKVSFLGTDFKKPDLRRGERPILLINATPLGMKKEDSLPFPESLLDSSWIVADLIYRPYETPLLLAAKKRGANIIPGIGMLLHQGALSFEIWTKESAPIQVMREALARGLEE